MIRAYLRAGVIFGLGPGNNHLGVFEDENRGLGVTNTHDDRRETLAQKESTEERAL
jgi:hypothetical protein